MIRSFKVLRNFHQGRFGPYLQDLSPSATVSFDPIENFVREACEEVSSFDLGRGRKLQTNLHLRDWFNKVKLG